MLNLQHRLILAAIAFCGLILPTSPAHAENPVGCYSNTKNESAQCHVRSRSETRKTPAGQASSGTQVCKDNETGDEIPCTHNGAWWNQQRQCYLSVAKPQPDRSEPIWEGKNGGVVMFCAKQHLGTMRNYYLWMESAAPAPDPEVLAQEAIAQMNLSAIRIGTYPTSSTISPESMGFVGYPVWMWAQDPDEHTWGPITRSASAGGHTVTATARVSHVAWHMGDGTTVTCHRPGHRVPHPPPGPERTSPTCGHRYTTQGHHTVTATSHWTITWNGAGQHGTIPLELSASTTLTIGELQVVNVYPSRNPHR